MNRCRAGMRIMRAAMRGSAETIVREPPAHPPFYPAVRTSHHTATVSGSALQRSRERLVLAREEERRRIRRDLHDGFGPTLASQTLKLDTVLEQLAGHDLQSAQRHVAQLKSQIQQM